MYTSNNFVCITSNSFYYIGNPGQGKYIYSNLVSSVNILAGLVFLLYLTVYLIFTQNIRQLEVLYMPTYIQAYTASCPPLPFYE